MTLSPPGIERSRILFWSVYFSAFLALGLWLGLNATIGLRNAGSNVAAWEPLSWELSSVALISLLAIAVYRSEQRYPLSGANWSRWLPLHVLAALLFSLVHVIGMVGIRHLVYAIQGEQYDFRDPVLGFAYELQKDLITYAIIIGA